MAGQKAVIRLFALVQGIDNRGQAGDVIQGMQCLCPFLDNRYYRLRSCTGQLGCRPIPARQQMAQNGRLDKGHVTPQNYRPGRHMRQSSRQSLQGPLSRYAIRDHGDIGRMRQGLHHRRFIGDQHNSVQRNAFPDTRHHVGQQRHIVDGYGQQGLVLAHPPAFTPCQHDQGRKHDAGLPVQPKRLGFNPC